MKFAFSLLCRRCAAAPLQRRHLPNSVVDPCNDHVAAATSTGRFPSTRMRPHPPGRGPYRGCRFGDARAPVVRHGSEGAGISAHHAGLQTGLSDEIEA